MEQSKGTLLSKIVWSAILTLFVVGGIYFKADGLLELTANAELTNSVEQIKNGLIVTGLTSIAVIIFRIWFTTKKIE
jgi:hypothetical protein